MNQTQTPYLRNLAKRRLDASGFSPNAVAFCYNLGLLCLGDKNGFIYMISLARHRLILKFQLKQPIAALKYVSPHKALFIVSGPKIFKFDFKKSRITMDKMMEFWPCTAEYVEKHNAIGFAGDTFNIRFYDMNLKYQFSINYGDPSRTIGSLLLLERQNVLLAGLDNGTIAVYDMNTTRLTWQDRKQTTPVNYIKYIEKEDILLSGAEEGKLYMRQLDKYQGFKTRACTWMKKNEILGMVMLKDESYMACIHADVNCVSIVRVKDWQVVQKLAVFSNRTGGTNLVALGKGKVVLATEKAEGYYYLMKSM